MIIAQCFVEFIFYSFLGWVWESIYCTIVEKKWADRGFLFGPICPIYGASVVITSILFSSIPAFKDPSFPLWAIFIICMLGSAVMEFGTSWVLEKRFNARWWDYSNLPLNVQGRTCLPVSVCFGIAGVLVVKFLIPFITGMHASIHPLVYEALAMVLAAIFGADLALTEASLSALLKNVEKMHTEFLDRAQANYEKVYDNVSSIGSKISKEKHAMGERVSDAKAGFSRLYAEKLSFNQKRILVSIKRFMPDKTKTNDQNRDRIMLIGELKGFVRDFWKNRKQSHQEKEA